MKSVIVDGKCVAVVNGFQDITVEEVDESYKFFRYGRKAHLSNNVRPYLDSTSKFVAYTLCGDIIDIAWETDNIIGNQCATCLREFDKKRKSNG